MNGDDRIALVVGTGEQRLGFQLLHQRAQVIDLAAQIVGDVLAFPRQLEVRVNVAGTAHQSRVRRQSGLQALTFAHDLL